MFILVKPYKGDDRGWKVVIMYSVCTPKCEPHHPCGFPVDNSSKHMYRILQALILWISVVDKSL